MKYKEIILRKFSDLGFTPRDFQIKPINDIVTASIDDKIETVILSSPVGSGKSLIAVVAAEVLAELTAWDKQYVSLITMGQNSLAKQYAESFMGNQSFLVVKGGANYDCTVTQGTAESCVSSQLKKADMDDIIQQHCNKCEYKQMQNRKPYARHLITNFSYQFVDRMLLKDNGLKPRLINVIDEGHIFGDAFTEHNCIAVSEKRLDSMIDELSNTLKTSNIEIFGKLKKFRADFTGGNITEDNYVEHLDTLSVIYAEARDSYQKLMENCIKKGMKNFDTYTKFSKLYKKYEGLFCKIDDLFIYGYEHVYDYKEKEQELTIKPIFVGAMYEQLRNSRFTLFMSGTMNEDFMINTLNLDRAKTKYIQVDAVFPPENKIVVFYKPMKLNYSTMADPLVVSRLMENCAEIFRVHDEMDQRGLFLAPSFDVAAKIAVKLRTEKSGTKIFEHERGQKIVDVLSMFKNYVGKAILISPSVWEGIDLKDEQSEYQVIVKSPYPALGDKRMKYIADKYPAVYRGITIQKIVQGCGRSVRSPTDSAITYCLDSSTKWLFLSAENSWLAEFNVHNG